MDKKKEYIELYGQEGYFHKQLDSSNNTTIVECVLLGEYEDRGSIRKGKNKLDKFYVDGYIGNIPIHDFDHNLIATGASWKNIRVVKNYETINGKIIEKALIGELHVPNSARMYYKDNNGIQQDRGSLREAILEGKLPFVSVFARAIDMQESEAIRHIYTYDLVAVSSLSQPAGQQYSTTKIIQKNMKNNKEEVIKKCLCNAYMPELLAEYYINAVTGGIYKVLEATETMAKIINVVTSEEMDVTIDQPEWEQLIEALPDSVDEYLMVHANNTDLEEDSIAAIQDSYTKAFIKACKKCQAMQMELEISKLEKNKEPKNTNVKNIKKEANLEIDSNTQFKDDTTTNSHLEPRISKLEQSITSLISVIEEKIKKELDIEEQLKSLKNELLLTKSLSKPQASVKSEQELTLKKMNLPFKVGL